MAVTTVLMVLIRPGCSWSRRGIASAATPRVGAAAHRRAWLFSACVNGNAACLGVAVRGLGLFCSRFQPLHALLAVTRLECMLCSCRCTCSMCLMVLASCLMVLALCLMVLASCLMVLASYSGHCTRSLHQYCYVPALAPVPVVPCPVLLVRSCWHSKIRNMSAQNAVQWADRGSSMYTPLLERVERASFAPAHTVACVCL